MLPKEIMLLHKSCYRKQHEEKLRERVLGSGTWALWSYGPQGQRTDAGRIHRGDRLPQEISDPAAIWQEQRTVRWKTEDGRTVTVMR